MHTHTHTPPPIEVLVLLTLEREGTHPVVHHSASTHHTGTRRLIAIITHEMGLDQGSPSPDYKLVNYLEC